MIPLRRTRLRGFSRVSLRESRCRLLSSAPFRVRPHAWSTKNDQPEPVALTIFGWAVRGSACCAGGRCGASRLARCAGKCSRISSAPHPDGFDPMRGQQKSDQPEPVALTIFGWAVRGSACCADGRCGALRLARYACKRLRVSSAPRPFGFDPMQGQQKRRPTEVDRLNLLWWAVRGSNPGPWD